VSDWTQDWQEVIDAAGQDFSDGQIHYGADAVEASAIRRFLEPLEFACALHYDADVARQHGYPDIIAPYSATMSWAMPAMWSPGNPPIFTDNSRDAQPARSPINNQNFPLGPRTTGFFATDIELDFLRPVTLGERLGRRGHRLISCVPKETTVGRGAFMKWESEIVAANGDVVMRMRVGTYAYQPHQPSGPAGEENGA
jgi:N-terminal half of MaoC dehydratase